LPQFLFLEISLNNYSLNLIFLTHLQNHSINYNFSIFLFYLMVIHFYLFKLYGSYYNLCSSKFKLCSLVRVNVPSASSLYSVEVFFFQIINTSSFTFIDNTIIIYIDLIFIKKLNIIFPLLIFTYNF